MSVETWKAHYTQRLCGVKLATRFVHKMPRATVAERVERAAALTDALRVMSMGDWRPVFPYFDAGSTRC